MLLNATQQNALLKKKQRHEIVLMIHHNIVQTPLYSVAVRSKRILWLRMQVQYNAKRSA